MSDWLPISDLPKDENIEILLIGKYPDGKTWSDIYHSWNRGVTDLNRLPRWPHAFDPTHWQPLPVPQT